MDLVDLFERNSANLMPLLSQNPQVTQLSYPLVKCLDLQIQLIKEEQIKAGLRKSNTSVNN